MLCISTSFWVLHAPKSWSKPKYAKKTLKKVKNQPKKDKFKVPPQGVDQLLHVNQL